MAGLLSDSTPMTPPLSFLIYGERRLLRELLVSQLAIRSGLHVVTHTGRATDATLACREQSVDMLLLAISSPNDGSLDVAREFTAHRTDGRVIVLTECQAPFATPEWLADSVVAVIGTHEPLQRLWSVIDTLVPMARKGQEPRLRRRLGGRSLSQRESEVFTLIGEGLTNAQIARRLALSDHTVRTHRKRIAAKLGTEGGDLTRWAIVSRHSPPSTPCDA